MEEEDPPSLPTLSFNLSKILPETRALYDVLQCPICYEPMQNPVMALSCSHNFCSMCVRRYLLYKQQCPSCFQPLHDTDLKPNKTLILAMEAIARLVPNLETLVKEVRPGFKLPLKSPAVAATPNTKIKKKEMTPMKSIPIIEDSPKPSTSMESSMISSQGPPPSPQSNKVSCPVCSVSIPEKNVNAHLDRCLAEQKGELPLKPATSVNRMQPMKSLVFHLLKDNEIKKRLREQGLDVKGDRNALIRRLKSFIAVWNSQCDLEKPLSKVQIVMKVHKDEKSLQKAPVAKPTLLDFDAKTDPKVIENKQREYVEQNKNHFKNLVAQARLNKDTKKPSMEIEANEEAIEEIDKSCSKPSDVTTDISQLSLTPKRKLSGSDVANEDDGKQPLSSKRPRQLFDAPKPVYSKAPCPVCNEPIAENLIQSHVERCLEKPEPRSMRKSGKGKQPKKNRNKEEMSDEEEGDVDIALLNATPEIILENESEDDLICSTPISGKENRRTTRRRTRDQDEGDKSPIL